MEKKSEFARSRRYRAWKNLVMRCGVDLVSSANMPFSTDPDRARV